MRRRLAFAVIALSLPAADLAAQVRIGRPPQGVGRPGPVEKPPLAPGIPDNRALVRYRLSRFSVESYPMLTMIQSTGIIAQGVPSDFTMFGDGTHFGFRATPSLFLTGDLTSAAFGAPISFGSVDFGARVKPWTTLRFRPFIDARISHAYTVPFSGMSNVVPMVLLTRSTFGEITTGRGNGATLGIGGETSIKTNWIVSTSLSSTTYAMTGHELTGQRREWKYSADVLRLAVGLRYNPGRWFDSPR